MMGLSPQLIALLIKGNPAQQGQVAEQLGYPPSPFAPSGLVPTREQEEEQRRLERRYGFGSNFKPSSVPPWVQQGMSYKDWKKATPEPDASGQAWDDWYNRSQNVNYMGKGMSFSVSPRARENLKNLFKKVF